MLLYFCHSCGLTERRCVHRKKLDARLSAPAEDNSDACAIPGRPIFVEIGHE